MEIQNKRKSIATPVALVCFFALLIVLEWQIKPTSQLSNLLVVLKKSAVYALVAVSMNLLNGFTGLFSLGQAGFMLIGAYVYAILSIPAAEKESVYRYYESAVSFSIPEIFQNAMGGFGLVLGVVVTILISGIVVMLVAYFIGLPVLRLKSDYLAIATLGFAEIIRAIFQWGKLGPVTNGSNPLRNYVRQNAFRISIGEVSIAVSTFFLALMSAVCIGIIVLLINSSYGRAFKAIREDEIAAESMGINLYKHKQLSFCISSFFTGIGGALLAIFMGSVIASNFRASMTYELLLIVVLGGIGSISGSVIGTMLFVFSSEWWLRGLDSGTFLGISSPLFRNGFRLVVFSVIIMLVVLFFRKGIMGDKELPYVINSIKEKLSARMPKKPKASEQNGR